MNEIITQKDRNMKLKQKGGTIWFTGLSGAGKTTLSIALEKYLFDKSIVSYRLDGDLLRAGINADLKFSDADRKENIRRVSYISSILADAGMVVLAAFISPFEEDRQFARAVNEAAGNFFLEVFVDSPLDVCMARDPKGLYEKTKTGQLKNFTGIDSPYEVPRSPNLIIPAATQSIDQCVLLLYSTIQPLVTVSS